METILPYISGSKRVPTTLAVISASKEAGDKEVKRPSYYQCECDPRSSFSSRSTPPPRWRRRCRGPAGAPTLPPRVGRARWARLLTKQVKKNFIKSHVHSASEKQLRIQIDSSTLKSFEKTRQLRPVINQKWRDPAAIMQTFLSNELTREFSTITRPEENVDFFSQTLPHVTRL